MQRRFAFVLVGGALIGAAGCASDNSDYIARLQSALAQSQISLRESIPVAESTLPDSFALQARLHVEAAPVYSVGAWQAGALHDVRVDIVSAAVISTSDLHANAWTDCPGDVGLVDALATAEARVDGVAVAVEPDDDDPCYREIQVLSGDTLWEVKVGSDGSIIEVEVSDEGLDDLDEDEGEDDDD